MNWVNDYIGIAYKEKGRDRDTGLDCWGLVRLIQREQFGNELPSFVEQQSSDPEKLQEIFATQREGWIAVDEYKVGDVVLFRMLGYEMHVGTYIGENKFIHVREGFDSVVERLDSGKWKSRKVGVFRYHANSLIVSAVPHPLKTQHIDMVLPSDLSLVEIEQRVKLANSIPQEIETNAIIMVDGKIVPREQWQDFKPLHGQRVEYRSVPTGGDAKNLIKAAIIIASVYYGGPVVAETLGVAYTGGTAAAINAGITVAASYLGNSIFPVRLPELPQNEASFAAKSQLMLQGGQNRENQFGAIPVVLGQFRFTPPLGAINYSETNATTNYLRMLLVWGYGPLSVTDLRVGDVELISYEDITYETIYDYETESGDEITRFNSIYGQDVSQDSVAIELVSDGTDGGSPWREQVISDQCDQISIAIHFPEGLRKMPIEGSNAGKIYETPFVGAIEYRQLDSDTLDPVTDWADARLSSKEQTFSFSNASFKWAQRGGNLLRNVHRWTIITYDENFNIKRYDGSLADSATSISTPMLNALKASTSGLNTSYQVIPTIPDNEVELWRVRVYGNSIAEVVDKRVGITGCELTYSGLKATLASGYTSYADGNNVKLGASGQAYYKRKDAFTYVYTFGVTKGSYEVRVRRTNDSESDYLDGGNKGIKYHKAIFSTVTGFENVSPVVAPKGVKLCMTAIRVKATDQLNGSIDGISGTVQSVCKDYDVDTDTWIEQPTSNPASLFRYVLQHPANAQAVDDSKINIDELEVWHQYCQENDFTFDMVVINQRSLMDVLRDICAAGRSSPTLRDGKWTVITDKPQSTVVQYFTPHNSWGFESSKSIPKLPHAFRVGFNNGEKSYQPDEMIVYNDGYTSSNATLFESLSLAGVTEKDQIYKHARFHLAQLKLRPERYSLNVDFEHLICTRGDLVRVTHDVPMWGLGTGRIKSYVDSNTLELDEAMPMDAGVQYTIRIRLEDGSSITRTVSAKTEDGYYTTIDLTSTLTSTEGKAGNLFMFGSLSDESTLLIVQSIEPADSMTARLTLSDYSPAVYDSDSETIPTFESNITKPPLLQQLKITQSPTIGDIVSDESVLVRLSQNSYEYRIKVNFTNPASLSKTITKVHAQLDFANDKVLDWEFDTVTDAKARSIVFGGVEEGATYKIRMRYADDVGRFGPWVYSSNHTVVGKTNPPASVGTISASVEGAFLRLDWADNTEPDFEFYEVRTSDSGWGDSSRIFKGKVSNCVVTPASVGIARTWYIKAVDSAGNYSTTSSSYSYTAGAIANPTSVSHVFADTALTNATITLDWSDVAPIFGLKYYEITYGSTTKTVSASTITLPADWIGSRNFTIKTVDNNGNKSSGYVYSVTKLVPSSPINFRAQVIDNTLMFYWTLPSKTTLPIDHCVLKRGSTWESATLIGEKKGEFTTLNENAAGTYTYWIVAVDTDNNESTPVSVSAKVSEPPDFVFHGDFTSTFSGTKSSAVVENSTVVLPVNTSETWTSHFTSRGWSTPQDQVNAGYSIFIEPTTTTGYYEETFDFGTILASSQITLTYSGATEDGTPSIKTDISVSDDNVTYTTYEDTSSIYATNFRYVKVKFSIHDSTGNDLYRLNSLYVRLDAKLKNDAGNVSALSTDTNGTIVNFSKEFIDVQSIVLSPSGTSSTTAVYDFQDANLSATYSVSSNVCTVTYSAHGFIAGQKVRLQFSTGTGVAGVYTIASATTNSFTVAMTTANTSGNCLVYAESFRVYLFNSAGTRVSATASWSVKGY